MRGVSVLLRAMLALLLGLTAFERAFSAAPMHADPPFVSILEGPQLEERTQPFGEAGWLSARPSVAEGNASDFGCIAGCCPFLMAASCCLAVILPHSGTPKMAALAKAFEGNPKSVGVGRDPWAIERPPRFRA